MISVTRRQRGALLFLSAAGYTAWLSGLGDRTDAQGLGPAGAATIVLDERRSPPPVMTVIKRDPFAAKPEPRDSQPAVQEHDSRPQGRLPEAATVGDGRHEGPLVPDIRAGGDGGGAASTRLTLALRATIVGADSVAYVENGTVMDIVRVGDALGERRVVKIDLHGIAFDDGTRLDLPDHIQSAQPPTPSATGRPLTIDDLRRLLAPAHAAQSAPQAPPRTPQPAPTDTYPTPAALQTADRTGLPVGVNPTENPYGPTPYPYPYPYAPPAPR